MLGPERLSGWPEVHTGLYEFCDVGSWWCLVLEIGIIHLFVYLETRSLYIAKVGLTLVILFQLLSCWDRRRIWPLPVWDGSVMLSCGSL